MKTIKLTKGKIALVDDEDFERVNQFKWCADFSGHEWRASRLVRKNNIKTKIYMHQFIYNVVGGTPIDHINGNSLDNQKSNLRKATTQQNAFNRKKTVTNTSGYKGVYFDPHRNRWIARIKTNGIRKNLGRFKTAIDAARAYDSAAKKFFGLFARTNF